MNQFFFERNPFTWVYGSARTVLAIGTLITLFFSEPGHIFDQKLYEEVNANFLFSDYNFFYLWGYENLQLSMGLAMMILLLTLTGYYPRYTGVLHWWVSASFFYSSSIIEGGDQITSIITLLLIPVTLLDHRKWHWQDSKDFGENRKFVGNLVLLIITVQMSMIYLNAVTDKVYSTEEWKIGSAFYYYVNDPFFSYPDWMNPMMEKLLGTPLFVSSITWGTLLLEMLLFGVLFSSNDKRRLLFPIAVIFHFMIILFLGLVSFFFAMVGGLIIYLIPPSVAQPKLFWKSKKLAVAVGGYFRALVPIGALQKKQA